MAIAGEARSGILTLLCFEKTCKAEGCWVGKYVKLSETESMDLTTVLMDLYRSEINCSISSFWDNGFLVQLGDDMNGFFN